MCKQFTSYLLPFLMNIILLRLLRALDLLERMAGHIAATYYIATAVRNTLFLGNPPPPIYVPTTCMGHCTLLCFSIMYSWRNTSIQCIVYIQVAVLLCMHAWVWISYPYDCI
jgi:hypothetical protein